MPILVRPLPDGEGRYRAAYGHRRLRAARSATSPAAILIAILLQKGEAVRSPGGYLRSLTAKAGDGTFSLGPPLMALQAARLKGRRGRP